MTKSENRNSDRVLSDVDAAYFAGFVDGEGTITIVRTVRKERRSGRQYHPTLSVASTNLEILEWLRDTCGNGWIKTAGPQRDRAKHRTLYHLRFTYNQIRHVLPQLRPYLRIKKAQCDLLLDFLRFTKKADGNPKGQEYWNRIETFRAQICAMNVRGLGKTVTPDLVVLRKPIWNNQYTKP